MNKNNSNGLFKLKDINSYILGGNYPNSFYEPNSPKILSSNYYTQAGLGDNLMTTFSEHITSTGVLS
jgi:hypothetical protein